jgi:hypothetical protein
MLQYGQLIRLKRTGRDGELMWAYRYRVDGRDAKRVQRGGFASSRTPSFGFRTQLHYDGTGLVLTYPGIAIRVA